MRARAGRSKLTLRALVRLDGTLVFLMGLSALEQVTDGLLTAGIAPDMPAAVIENGARGTQRKVVATIAGLADRVRAAGLRSPALIVVGQRLCGLSDTLDWFTSLPLHGKTRGRDSAARAGGNAGLADGLRALGAEVTEAPCIETASSARDTRLRWRMRSTQRHDWAVFTSSGGRAGGGTRAASR